MLLTTLQNKPTHQLNLELDWLHTTQQYRVKLVRYVLDQDPSHMEFYLSRDELQQFRAALQPWNTLS